MWYGVARESDSSLATDAFLSALAPFGLIVARDKPRAKAHPKPLNNRPLYFSVIIIMERQKYLQPITVMTYYLDLYFFTVW